MAPARGEPRREAPFVFAPAGKNRAAMASWGSLDRTPYSFLARRPFREERLLSYIRRQHLRGRHLTDILDDPYVHRCGSDEFVWATLRNTALIDLLEADVREAIQRASAAVSNQQ